MHASFNDSTVLLGGGGLAEDGLRGHKLENSVLAPHSSLLSVLPDCHRVSALSSTMPLGLLSISVLELAIYGLKLWAKINLPSFRCKC